MKPGAPSFPSNKAGQLLLWTCVLALMLIASAFFGLTVKQDEMIRNYVAIAARDYFDSIVITRRWNANYGGVYVLKAEGMASNPYLINLDIMTKEGIVYTMKNPALMTREISELAARNGGYRYHITSLKLMNPANAPDEWEKNSLIRFEAGQTRETTLLSEENGKKIFRLMRPLFYEKGCIACHEKQGYALGDVRGGISVTLPYDDIAAGLKKNRLQMMALAAFILFCLAGAFYFGIWRLISRLAATNIMLAGEREKFRQLNEMLDRNVEERTKKISAVNEMLLTEAAERRKVEEKLRLLNNELEQRVQERAAELTGRGNELAARNRELEQLNKLFVEREFRIKELRDQVAALQKSQGKTKENNDQ